MNSPKAAAIVAMEVFVEEQQVAPVRILKEGSIPPLEGAPTCLFIWEKESYQSGPDFACDLAQVHFPTRAGGAFDLETIAIKVVIALQCLQ